MASAHYVLVPGLWLGGWAWDATAAALIDLGHTVEALTLPGLERPTAARAAITQDDHVGAILAALDRHPRGSILVGHAGAAELVYLAADRAPTAITRLVYLDTAPLSPGTALLPTLAPDQADIPFPSWTELETAGNSSAGLDDRTKSMMAALAVPHPAGPLRTPIDVHNDERYRVPTTMITSSFTVGQVRDAMRAGHPMTAELAKSSPTIIGLPTGHWPMLSRPEDLARVLAAVECVNVVVPVPAA